MAKASADVAITAPRPTATTTSWVQKPRISPKVAKQPRAKPWLSEALITAIAPGPGEKLIAQAAMKKASQSDSDIVGILPAAIAATIGRWPRRDRSTAAPNAVRRARSGSACLLYTSPSPRDS